MPDIGRFFNVDPLSDEYVYNSPYAFAENKLGRGVELEGLELGPFPYFFFARPAPLVRPAIVPRVAPRPVTPRWSGPENSSGNTRPISWERISPSNAAKSGSRGGKGAGKDFTETTKRNNWNQKNGEGKEGQCADCGTLIRRGIKSEKGEATPPEQAQGDHMAPKNPKDGNIPGNNSADNLQWLCPGCNGSKSNIAPEQYYDVNLAPADATQLNLEKKPSPEELQQNAEQIKQQNEREEFFRNGGV